MNGLDRIDQLILEGRAGEAFLVVFNARLEEALAALRARASTTSSDSGRAREPLNLSAG